jgi:NAD-dependent SIR2 family protein deacetylase
MLEAARQPTFDPVTIVTELSTKLSARTRHISVFLGAGASMTAGLPDLSSMSNIVVKALTPAQQPIAQELARERNLEQMLTPNSCDR